MSRQTQIRVGFVLFPIHLLGMHNYLRNLFAAILSLPGEPITPVLLAGAKYGDVSAEFGGLEIIRTSMLDRGSPSWWSRQIVTRLTGKDILLQRLLNRHKVTVLSHSSGLGSSRDVKSIGWIADLQHMHFPELFPEAELRARDAKFRELCDRCDCIIVGSEYGLKDLAAFSPKNAEKGVVLHFIASPTMVDGASRCDLEAAYGFQGPYFLLPNQFWPHKNHQLLIEALHVARQRGEEFHVLLTGAKDGSPDPMFFPSLLKRAEELGVSGQFHALGVIPFPHLVGLMQNCVAFINPSKFEGWSTSVEEAKSLGKQILLSDIPVHREQNPPRSFFFHTEDAAGLADAMTWAMLHYREEEDQQMQCAARKRYPERLREFGEAYSRIVAKTVYPDSTDLRLNGLEGDGPC